MVRMKAFTLIELLVVISIIALLIGILLPALGAARRTANEMKNSTQIRGIIQGCILYAQGNNDYYPGVNSNGDLVAATDSPSGTTQYWWNNDGKYPATRYAILLNGNYFVPQYMINPQDTKTQAALGTDVTGSATNTGNFSYAMLELNETAGTTDSTGHESLSNDIRNNDWKDTTNSQAVVLSDRNTGTGADNTTAKSMWTTNPGDWRGSVGWNDNHVTFESQPLVTTRYTGGVTIDAINGTGTFGTNHGDNLFTAGDTESGVTFTGTNYDAALVCNTATDLTGQ